MTATDCDALIIGAGVVGCSIACELSRRGWRTVVVDKGPAVGAGSTSSSSAIVRFHYSTLAGVTLSWESAQLWRRWSDHLGVADELGPARFHRTGMLVLDAPPPAPDPSRIHALFDLVGVPYEVMDASAMHRAFPTLDLGRYHPPKPVEDEAFFADPAGEVTGYFMPDGGFVDDPALAAHNLMVAAEAHGARFRFRTAVVGVDGVGPRVGAVTLADGASVRASVVVNAAGPHSSQLNRLAGVEAHQRITTRPLRQEVHVLPAPPGFALADGAPCVGDADLGTYFRPQMGGTLLIGGIEPECDPLVWIGDPDTYDELPSRAVWEAQTLRVARRLPELGVPGRPVGLAALYDVTPDWVPIYDRSSLGGYYQAVGTSGNQFKNAPMIGLLMAELVEACESGRDHDADPVQVRGPVTGNLIDLGHFSRLRTPLATSNSVMG